MRSVHRFAGIGLPDRHPGHYPIEQLLIPIEGTAYTSARPDSSRSPRAALSASPTRPSPSPLHSTRHCSPS